MRRIFNELDGERGDAESPDRWVTAVEGIVVDNNDPEKMHRIKAVIPAIDENIVCDEWITAMLPWCGPAGYGPVNPPALNTEVLIFGRFAQPHTLFYLCRYNEDHDTPAEFADGSRGLKTDTKYKLLADLLIEIVSQQSVLIRATNQADVNAALVRLLANDTQIVRCEPDKVGFLGAAAIARRTLPTPATNLASCVELTNAMRQLLIDLGFAD